MGVAALYALLAVTAGWWALALWPVPEAPEWLARTRWVCFNAAPNGLPDVSGWLLLVGQPIGMLAVLMAGWGRAVRSGLRALAARSAGRTALGATGLLLVAGLALAGVRVTTAERSEVFALGQGAPPLDGWPRLDREAPALGLVDQHGERLELARLRGRPALVTFAFGHCGSFCPALVRQTLEAQQQLRARAAAGETQATRIPRVVILTMDPWRDTPSRLPHLAKHWGVDEDGFVLSGQVDQVNRVLDAWGVARSRDAQSGEVTHPPLVYVLDAWGRIAYGATGDVATIVALVERSQGDAS